MKTRLSWGTVKAGELAVLCGGTLWNDRGGEILVDMICTDSREVDGKTAFCAMRGERVDGHDFIARVIADGCRCVICERSSEAIEAAGAAAIVVKDVELALAKLGNAFRQRLSCHTVGVTGSVGKTTAKELIASVLSVKHRTYKTEGNRNSVIGMPLSVTEIPTDTQWAVLEMGMNHVGEIERLSVTAEPDVAVITTIGTAHMEMLGSRENICRAKLEILCGLRTGGVLLLNGDEPLLEGIGGKSYRTLYVSLFRDNADFYAKNIRVEDGKTRFDVAWSGGEVKDLAIGVMGRHNVYAALFAFAIGTMSGMTPEEIRQGLGLYHPDALRQCMTQCGQWTFIEDCYNASPESMRAALEVLSDYCKRHQRRSVAVLGDMLELGSDSPTLHRSVGEQLAALGVDRLFAVGESGALIALGAGQAGMSADRIGLWRDIGDPEGAAKQLRELLQEGDVVLFKASRAVGAEWIAAALKK